MLALISVTSLSAGQVLLDHVEGAWFDGTNYNIIPNSPVKFYIRLINDDNETATSLSNGFQVFSPTSSFTPVSGQSLLDPEIFSFLI